jgi:hypothetical protein
LRSPAASLYAEAVGGGAEIVGLVIVFQREGCWVIEGGMSVQGVYVLSLANSHGDAVFLSALNGRHKRPVNAQIRK